MKTHTIAIFGESQLGNFHQLVHIQSLPELAEKLGNPTATGLGIHLAVQAMLFHRSLLFYRIEEEGFSRNQYRLGLQLLQKKAQEIPIIAIALPGVGSSEILMEAKEVCELHKSLILLSESDLYDFMTQNRL